MQTSGIHSTSSPYGLSQIAKPQADRIPGKTQSEKAADLAAVIDRVTINRTKAETAPISPDAAERTYGKSLLSPAYLAKNELAGNTSDATFGKLVASWAQRDR